MSAVHPVVLQPGEANHSIATDFCQQNLQYHRYLDTSPSAVTATYEELEERLGANAQLEKQRALADLRQRYLECGSQAAVMDLNHGVLLLLSALSRNLLASEYEAPPSLPQNALLSGGVAGGGNGPGDEPGSDWGDEGAVFSDGDTLSEWGGTDDSHSRAGSATASPAPRARLGSASVRKPGGLSSPSTSPAAIIAARYVRCPGLVPPSREQGLLPPPPVYEAGCLLNRLASGRLARVAFLLPPPEKCSTEHLLSVQALQMMRGPPVAGPGLQLTRDGAAVVPVAGVHVPHLSPGSLLSLLQCFAAAATDALRLQQFVDLATSSVAGSEARTLPRGAPITATTAAFASAVRAELQHIGRSLSIVEIAAEPVAEASSSMSGVQSHGGCHPSSRAPGLAQLQRREGPRLTLLGTLAAVQGPKRRLAFLAEVLTQVHLDEPMDAAAASAWLLDQLVAMLDQRSSLADPQGAGECALLLRLLAAALRPLMDAVRAWVATGTLDDPHQEFFVQQREMLEPSAGAFWQGAYCLRRTHGGAVACPTFLRRAAPAILDAGKAAILLRHSNSDRRGPPGGASVGVSPPADVLPHSESGYGLLRSFAEAVQGTCLPGDGHVVGVPPGAPPAPAPAEWRTMADYPPAPGSPRYQPFAQRMAAASASWGTVEGSDPGDGQRCSAARECSEDVGAPGTPPQAQPTSPQPSSHEDNLSALPDPDPRTGAGGCDGSAVLSHPASPPAPQPPASLSRGGATPSSVGEAEGGPERDVAEGGPDEGGLQLGSLTDWYTQTLAALSSNESPPGGPLDFCQVEGLAAQGGRTQCGEYSGTRHSSLQKLLPDGPGIAPYTGRAVEQIWGSHGKGAFCETPTWRAATGSCVEAAGCTAQLSGARLDMLPVSVLLQRCLYCPVMEQVAAVEATLLQRLMGDWGLPAELERARNLYTLATGALEPFSAALLRRLDAGERLAAIPAFDLQLSLQLSFPVASPTELLPPVDAISVDLLPPPTSKPAAAAVGVAAGELVAGAAADDRRWDIAELTRLRVRYRVAWPLSLVIDAEAQRQYNQILVFLMQVRWAKQSLEQLQMAGRWKRCGAGGGPPARTQATLQRQMLHCVSALHQFACDRVLQSAGQALAKALAAAQSLEGVRAAHQAYLAAAGRLRLASPKRDWHVLASAITAILNSVLQYCALVRARARLPEGAERASLGRAAMQVGGTFSRYQRYLVKVLTAMTAQAGRDSELRELLVMLNFNDYFKFV